MAGELFRLCPMCNSGLEWGKRTDMKTNEIVYYWRCSHCGYKGEEIVRLPNRY